MPALEAVDEFSLQPLSRTLDAFHVAQREKDEVLGAFAAHKTAVTDGYVAATAAPSSNVSPSASS
jgi:hypothetical protein